MKEAGVADTVVMTRPVRPQEGGIRLWSGRAGSGGRNPRAGSGRRR